jgi:outer membrane protein assembly factor BamB
MEEIKIKTFKNKNMSSAIAVLLIVSFVISIFAATGTVNAQEARDITTFPFVDAVPRTAGVGQPVLVNFGLLNYLAIDGDGWNVTLIITDPNGKTSTIDRMTWSTGTVGYYFVPDTIGTYTLQCKFDRVYYAPTVAGAAIGWYAASQSDTVQLVIQADSKADHPGYSLPDSYWTRPIDTQLREWWSIAGSWVARPRNAYAPYNDAPGSAHILWTMPMGDTLGGLSGGDNWAIGYQNGDAYEGKYSGSIIISGILYYNKYVIGQTGDGRSSPQQAIVAVNLHTGEKLWERSYDFGGSRISTGQVLTWLSMNNRGTWAYVWMTSGTNMFALDAATGDLKFNMTNVPAGTIYYGLNGEMLKYQIVNYGTADNPNSYLLQWNSSWVVTNGKIGMSESWGSQIQGATFNATERGYDLNVSIPTLTGSLTTAFPEDRVIVASVTASRVMLSSISIKPGEVGRVLFKEVTWAAPSVWQDLSIGRQGGWAAYSQEDKVAVYWTKENRVHYGFSIETGQFLWETKPQIYADAWSDSSTSMDKIIAYGKLYAASCGGTVYCYDVTNGALLWTYDAVDNYTESYLTENWWLVPVFISSNMLYLGHMEHSAQEPLPRGAPFIALNVETGEVVWKIDGAFRQTRWGGRAIIGDSVIATMDTYDNRVYAIGKGPSSMTVTAPDVAVAANTPVLIRGTIMDVSPGTDSTELKLRFPNGVPAVSDADMSEWMLHVYKQFPQPMATGVPVSIDAIDPNGNYVTLGTTVSDANGGFSFKFTPDKEGQYYIYALFDGSAAYYKTDAYTSLLVMPATENSSMQYALYAFIVGIVLIIVVVFIGLLILKKK